MKKLADDVYMLKGFPSNAVNVYVIGNVLIDSATRLEKNRILSQVRDHEIKAHALTHAHPDHQGSSKAVCEVLDIPLWCGAGDKYAMETGDYAHTTPGGRGNRFPHRLFNGRTHPVARTLVESDEIGGFTVLETPGHTPGHLAYWREDDGFLIAGDVFFGMSLVTTRTGLHEPPKMFTLDVAQNRESARRLASLEPKTVVFGHGKPTTDMDAFQAWVTALP